MADGVISLFLLIIMLFIFIGGWLRQELQLLGWKVSHIFFVLVGLWLSASIHLPYKEHIISLFGVLLPLIAFLMMKGLKRLEKFVVFWTSLLIAIIYNFLLYVFMIEPVLLIMEERLLLGGLIGLLVGFLYVPLKHKWIMATFGLWFGVLFFSMRQAYLFQRVYVLSYYELDLLYMIYFTETLVHCIIASVTQWITKKIRRVNPFS